MFKPRQPLAPLALCAIGGIVAADQAAPEMAVRLWPWATALAVLGFAGMGWRRLRKPLIAWLATAVLFFAWHAGLLSRGPGAALAVNVPEQGCVARAVGVVVEEPTPNARFQMQLESVTLGSATTPSTALILVRWSGELPRYGDRVEVVGYLHRLAPARNPGVFDSPKIWGRHGITCELRVRYPNDTRLLAHDCGPPFVARALALRHWMEATMALDLADSPDVVPLIQSMVLGSRGESLEETKKLFQYTGTMHLFAVSGMNVAMLATFSSWLLLGMGVKRRAAACVIIPLLWVFCYATGLTASSLRATIMATLVLTGFLIDRPALSWNTLGASVLVLLAWDPAQLFTPGFQLSFGMVAFLMAVGRPVQQWASGFAQPDPFLPRVLWSPSVILRCRAQKIGLEALCVSTIAWIGSMPLMVYYFHLWSPSTIPANVFAVALAWIMLILGMASVLTGAFCQGLAVIFNNANWLVAKVLLWGISALAAIPYGHVFMEMPSLKPSPLCEVEVLDVPGGGAIHLRTNQQRRREWLIDCGSTSAFTYSVVPYLRSRGVNRLDGFLLTHGDSQHIGGAAELLCEMNPKEVIDSPLHDRSRYRRVTQAALDASNKGKTVLARDDVITLAPGIVLHVLFPPYGLSARCADDQAFVLRLDAAGQRILFTSDAGFLTESWLLENTPADELRSDILIKQMHATDFSGTPEFLASVRPALIVASSTSFPPQEHISEEWASKVEASGIRLLRQDHTGAVKIILNAAGTWYAEPFLSPTGNEK